MVVVRPSAVITDVSTSVRAACCVIVEVTDTVVLASTAEVTVVTYVDVSVLVMS
jgi:hypothetical protein